MNYWLSAPNGVLRGSHPLMDFHFSSYVFGILKKNEYKQPQKFITLDGIKINELIIGLELSKTMESNINSYL